ncbi:MAG: efflux RND transporter periplasmic adaptor subunit [Bacteroidota bacterium]|nr:efflux RND transporter periplasmic adaptor subunit [Bacteroidota bacterium]
MRISIIITFLILFTACSSKQNENSKLEEAGLKEQLIVLTVAQFKNASIVVSKIEKRAISSIIKVNGKIDVPPQNMVSVSMPLGGYLKTTKLLPGMHIAKGEVIATMEDLQYIQLQQEYLTTKSKLVFAETELARQKELNQGKASSDKMLQQAQMDFSSQKITLSALAEKLKLININPQTLTENTLSKGVNIYSPIDGFVSKVNVNIGKYVNPSDILFELVNTTDIHLNIKVFEKDLNKLFIGQKVMAYNNHSDKKHICEIILISQDLSPERTAEVHCHFSDYDKTLLPGMYMNAEIETKNDYAMVLPEEAIVNFEGKDYVFVELKEREYFLTEIEIGIKQNGLIEILNGNSIKQKPIVTNGAYTLLMKLKNKSDE